MPTSTITSPTSDVFDVSTLRRLSTAGSGSGSGSVTNQNSITFSTDDGPELKDDPLHKQDWSKTTAAEESWAVRERRRQSMWSKAEMPISPKKVGGPRHGSVLSVWVSGKDKDGNDILVHDSGDEAEEELEKLENGGEAGDQKVVVIEEDPSEEVKKLRAELAEMKAKLARLEPEEVKDDGEFLLVQPADVTGEAQRRKSRGSRGSRGSAGAGPGSERRGSILSLWAQGTDKLGRPVIMHHDEEWKKDEDEVIQEDKEAEAVNGKA